MTDTAWTQYSGGTVSLNWNTIKTQLATNASDATRYPYSQNVRNLGLKTWNIGASYNLYTDSGRRVIFTGAYETWNITARSGAGSKLFQYYYTYDVSSNIEVWVLDNAAASQNVLRYVFARECNGQYPEHRSSAGDTLSAPALSLTTPDTTGPTVVITSPANNAIVTSASLTVSGTASDSGRGNNGISSVTVNGVNASGGAASGANTANWSATITLSPGANTITVVARDTLNNAGQQQITVNYNPTPIGPLNDNFVNRTTISANGATLTATNTGATKESGEPNHAGNTGGKSVWWRWTPTASGSAQIDTIGSSFDTILGVYTGSSVSTLTQVAADDDSGGSLTSKVTFNAMASRTYQIAVDGFGAASGNIVLHVIAPVNQAPTDIALLPSIVAENQPVNTVVGTFSTNDPNPGDTHTYSLVAGPGGTGNASFTISGNQLRTAAVFNFEAQSSYSIRVGSTDQGGLSFEKVFTITVTNVNETPTNIALSSTSIAENQPIGTVIGMFNTTDPDAGNTFTYILAAGTGGTGNGSFNIVGNQIRTNAIFDFETQANYSIRVKSTDQGGLSFEKVFAISVTNLNERPTDIVLSSSSVAENQPVSTAVGTFISFDPDAGNTFTYSLSGGPGGTGNGSFNIVGNQLRTNAIFDFETQANYSIRVQSTDQGGLSFEKVFAISVTNLNERPTDIVLSSSSVAENQPVATPVGTFISFDPDAGNSFTYSLVGGPGGTGNASFTISGNQLRTAAVFNFEAQSSYSIRVGSTDQGGLSFEKVFTITVTNVAETFTWSGASVADGNWTSGANWQGGFAPNLPGDDLVLPAGAARLSNTNSFAAATAFRTLTLSGAGYSLSGNAITLIAGLTDSSGGANTASFNITFGASATISVSAGTQLTVNGSVSAGASFTKDGTGQLLLNAPVNSAGTLTVVAGTLTVQPGATMTVLGAFTNTGSVAVGAASGAASTLTINGFLDHAGTLNVLPTGTLDLNGDTLAAGPVSNAGTLNVAAGKVLTLLVVFTQTGALSVGNTGLVNVAGGGTNSGSLTIGDAASIDFVAGSFTLAAGTVIFGGGIIRASGATVTLGAPVALYAFDLNGTGTLTGNHALSITGIFFWTGGTMSGAASTLITESALMIIDSDAARTMNQRTLDVAGNVIWYGNGSIALTGTAPAPAINIQATGYFGIGNDPSLTGTGTFTNAGTVQKIGSAGTMLIAATIPFATSNFVAVNDGTLNVVGGFTQTDGSTIVFTGATLESPAVQILNGTLSCPGTIAGNLTNGGFVVTGSDGVAEVMRINGNYTQLAGGVLSLELVAAGQADLLMITGTATLDGYLSILSGFTPSSGEMFTILTFASRMGEFINPLVGFTTNYGATSVTVVAN